MDIRCKGCGKRPHEIEEYVEVVTEDGGWPGLTPEEFVQREEGTYNRTTGQFWCTDCYIKVGMPLGAA